MPESLLLISENRDNYAKFRLLMHIVPKTQAFIFLQLAYFFCTSHIKSDIPRAVTKEQLRRSRLAVNGNLWGNSVGARDFSPDWKHRYFGTEVPCPDNNKHQFGEFLEVPMRQNSIG